LLQVEEVVELELAVVVELAVCKLLVKHYQLLQLQLQ
jgi:hypothetical protein